MTHTLRGACLATLLAATILAPATTALAAGPPPPPSVVSLKATHPHKAFMEQPGTSGGWTYYGYSYGGGLYAPTYGGSSDLQG